MQAAQFTAQLVHLACLVLQIITMHWTCLAQLFEMLRNSAKHAEQFEVLRQKKKELPSFVVPLQGSPAAAEEIHASWTFSSWSNIDPLWSMNCNYIDCMHTAHCFQHNTNETILFLF